MDGRNHITERLYRRSQPWQRCLFSFFNRKSTLKCLTILILALPCLLNGCASSGPDPLPSWNDGPVKQSIVGFVETTTTPGDPNFVEAADRIAVFDNDGTLWAEQPVYIQLMFVMDRLHQLAPQHPEWKTTQPYKAALTNDMETLHSYGEEGIAQLLMATHAGITTDQFAHIVEAWLAIARHPRYNELYTDCVYQPMLEVLNYLRANGYQTWIVSGGGIEFMRPWTEHVYGIPPQQVIGSSFKRKYVSSTDKPVIVRLPEIDFVNDKEGKPISIIQHIGKRPIAAFGNSDGDFQMLEWTTSGAEPRLGLIIHHTDEVREWAYDRQSHIGRLDRGLNEADLRGWLVADMKRDFKRIFPFDTETREIETVEEEPDEPDDEPGASLTETYWKLVELKGQPVTLGADKKELHIILKEDNTAGGYAGCNHFSGSYVINGYHLQLGPMAVTRRWCENVMEQEQKFLLALDNTNRFAVMGDILAVYDVDENLILRFKATTIK